MYAILIPSFHPIVEIPEPHGTPLAVDAGCVLEDAVRERVGDLVGILRQEGSSRGRHGSWPFSTTFNGIEHVNQ